MTMEVIKEKLELVVKGRKEFGLTSKEYNELDLEVQKELDRNFWRFPNFSKGYLFKEMLEEEKAHFRNVNMVIRHSIFE